MYSPREPHRHLEYYGCSKLLQQFNKASEKNSLRSQLHVCTARNDDPAGRTTRLIDEAFATLYDESGFPQPSPKSLLARHRTSSDVDTTNTNPNPAHATTEPGAKYMKLSYDYWRINKFLCKMVKHETLRFVPTFQGT